MLSCSYLVKKMSIFSKARFSHVIFSNFHEKPMLSCPYLVRKVLILSKLHWIMDQKVNRLPFFRFLQKITAVTPIFCQKNIYSWKTTQCHAHNQSKNVKFKIQGALISLFKFFSSKTSCSHAHIWLKTSILSKLQNIMGQKSLQDAISFRFSRKIDALMPISCPKDVHCLRNTLL